MPPEGKSDMDRVGLFKEMGYIFIGDKYTPFIYRPFNESAQKNKQMLSGGSKKKSALQDGYFDSQFKRIFEREALTDLIKIQRQYKIQQAKKNLGKAFLPSSGERKPHEYGIGHPKCNYNSFWEVFCFVSMGIFNHLSKRAFVRSKEKDLLQTIPTKLSGIGSYYGTLGGPVQAFSPLQVPKKPYKPSGKNMYTNPSKKGSGYGFPGVTLSKLDPHSPDPYERARQILKREMAAHKSMLKGGPFRLNLHPKEYFDGNPYKVEKPLPASKKPEEKKTHFAVPFKPSSPSKKIGGSKAGTFDLYPSHSADPYIVRKSRKTTTKEGKIFHPSPGLKSTPVKSIISLNVNKFLNSTNYNDVQSVMAY